MRDWSQPAHNEREGADDQWWLSNQFFVTIRLPFSAETSARLSALLRLTAGSRLISRKPPKPPDWLSSKWVRYFFTLVGYCRVSLK